MNVLFLFQRFSFADSTIYLDLVKAMADAGHQVFLLAGTGEDVDDTRLVDRCGCRTAYLKLPDQFKAGKIKKGIVQLLMEPMMLHKLRQLLWDQRIDLIVYPTPPITLAGVVEKAKKHYGAKTYLMLKDIFPQNAVDLKMMGKGGLIHRYFSGVERRLYQVSDVIGCMSPANAEYMKAHIPQALWDRLELFPNTVAVKPLAPRAEAAEDGPVRFVFGGNLGRPQGIDFLLQGIEALREEKDASFLVIGDGTEAGRVETFFRERNLPNAEFHKHLPREEYEEKLKAQDVGLVMLSPDFTIPNFPSRILSYMQMAKPVLVVTDRVSDMGPIAEMGGFGFFTPSDDPEAFGETIRRIIRERRALPEMGLAGREFLEREYNVTRSVQLLERAAGGEKEQRI